MMLFKNLLKQRFQQRYTNFEKTFCVLRSCVSLIRKTQTAHRSTLTGNLSLSTERAQLDEKVEISVNGLKAGQKVTLHTFVTDGGKTYRACGHYIADHWGQISTFKHQSFGGTFTGLEPMGLFWSLDNNPNERKTRLLTADCTVPYKFTICAQEGFINFQDLSWSGDVADTLHRTLDRHHIAPGVRRTEVEENGLYGTLFLPPGEGPFPAILDIYGLSGGIKEHRAALLATYGFATFALAYANYKDLPILGIDLQEMDLSLFLRAFDWLSSHPLVDSSAVGCVASCIGGGYAMFITAMRPGMRCLASFNNLGRPGAGQRQTVEGEEIHCVKMRPERASQTSDGSICFLDVFRSEDGVPVTPAWRHGAKFLFLRGEGDQCVSADMMEDIKAAFPEKYKENASFISYPGTGHLIEPPYQPLCTRSYNKVFKMDLVWGGEPKLHCQAQEDAWGRVLHFLKENLQAQNIAA